MRRRKVPGASSAENAPGNGHHRFSNEQEVPRRRSSEGDYSGCVASSVNTPIKTTGTCPVCGKAGKLDVTEKPPGSHPKFWVSCWVCPGGSAYTAALKEVITVPASLILDDPLTHLAPWLTSKGQVREYANPP